ncbi:type II toxin-antitoxin system VapC family toxin [Microlunatus sp. Y2014]|uniref:type II toxin-antitoxin system VapC family toxin n=1 Tax=Microlunatus sp. Y2014 TaxID=3418488 RepID=UPI003DA79AE7
MLVADANIVIAASTPGHVHHHDAVRIVAEFGLAGIVLHSLTMAEVLLGPARAGNLAGAQDRLTAAGFMLAPNGEPPPDVLARVRAATSLTMPDTCVLATAEYLRLDLATFDDRLAREAIGRGVRVRRRAG